MSVGFSGPKPLCSVLGPQQADNRTQHQHFHTGSGTYSGKMGNCVLDMFPYGFIFFYNIITWGSSYKIRNTSDKKIGKKCNNEQNFPDLGPDIHHHLTV